MATRILELLLSLDSDGNPVITTIPFDRSFNYHTLIVHPGDAVVWRVLPSFGFKRIEGFEGLSNDALFIFQPTLFDDGKQAIGIVNSTAADGSEISYKIFYESGFRGTVNSFDPKIRVKAS
jgi:hypothetical protein